MTEIRNDITMSEFARGRMYSKDYAHDLGGRRETWYEVAERVTCNVMDPFLPNLRRKVQRLVEDRKFVPGGRYLYACGRRWPQVNNCFLYRAQDSREGWAELQSRTASSLMTGGGVGVVYSDLRPKGSLIRGLGGKSTGPCSLMKIINEQGRYTTQGGNRRSAIWAGMHWNHPDIFEFISIKEWPDKVKALKATDFDFPAAMDMTNVSVILDDAFFAAYGDHSSRDYNLACNVYWATVRSMLRTGEPGFSVDIGDNDGENLRNACCEVTSRDDSDMCNLGSLNMARFDNVEDFAEAIEVCTAFLLCGTLYSKLPVEGMYKIREKNRRLGLGLMGLHEWLLVRGRRYGPCDELSEWLRHYQMSGSFANRWADRLSISRPIATRSIAPTGTISIVAETTSGVEPVPAVALKRRYREGYTWKAMYIIDPTAKRLIDKGIEPDQIEDAMSLAEDVERRMSFQAWLQEGYVDHGISSTINLPQWGSELNNEAGVTQFGNTLLKYLPRLRGITAYPDGSRSGQPLTRVPYEEAIRAGDVEFIDQSEEQCKSGACSS